MKTLLLFSLVLIGSSACKKTSTCYCVGTVYQQDYVTIDFTYEYETGVEYNRHSSHAQECSMVALNNEVAATGYEEHTCY